HRVRGHGSHEGGHELATRAGCAGVRRVDYLLTRKEAFTFFLPFLPVSLHLPDLRTVTLAFLPLPVILQTLGVSDFSFFAPTSLAGTVATEGVLVPGVSLVPVPSVPVPPVPGVPPVPV